MTFSTSLDGIVRHRADAGVSEKMPTSRWIGDGEAWLSSLLNSGSLNGVEHLSGGQPKTNPPIGPMQWLLDAHRRSKRRPLTVQHHLLNAGTLRRGQAPRWFGEQRIAQGAIRSGH
jgi:hypothetical protein